MAVAVRPRPRPGEPRMVVWNLPAEWTPWIAVLAQHLHGRLAWRLAPLLLGVVFAKGRRTVASWLRAAGVGADFPSYYYLLRRVGKAAEGKAASLLRLLLRTIDLDDRLLFALDDTPTRRYGPEVQGAGIHHGPAARGQGQRGRPAPYGPHKLSLAKRAGQRRGWQTLEAVLYGGRRVTKTVKTFVATWPPVGGALRVVLVREAHGWLAFFCTDV